MSESTPERTPGKKTTLTLHVDSEVEEQAEAIAREHGTSLSALVETYLRSLARAKQASDADADREPPDVDPPTFSPRIRTMMKELEESSPPDVLDAEFLTPRIRRMREELKNSPAPTQDLDEDMQAFVEAASKKHA